MRQINPLYLLLLLVVVLMIIVVRLDHAKNEQLGLKEELRKTEQMGERIRALKGSWQSASQTKKELQRLLRSAPLRQSEIVQTTAGGSIELSSASMDAQALEYLLNKLLNGSYTLKKLTLKRLDAKRASLQLEIAL